METKCAMEIKKYVKFGAKKKKKKNKKKKKKKKKKKAKLPCKV